MTIGNNRANHGGGRTLRGWRRPALAATVAATVATCAMAAEPATSRVEAGRTVWKDAGCEVCHGANGQGGTSPDQPAGPSLRGGKLDRKALIEVIACGRPGTQMAAWLKGAYTVTPCYAATTRPVPGDTIMVGALVTTDLDALVDYLQTAFGGK
jgi:mono/diheme cytochrome c family protein